MKKAFLILSAVLVLASTAKAQDTFYPGWQYSVKAGATYSAGESSFKDMLSYPTVALDAGYQFSPVFTLRGELSGFQSKGAIIPQEVKLYKFNYGQLNLDAVFDIANMFKYKQTRIINPYIFAGVGGNVRFNNQEAVAIGKDFYDAEYLWENPVLSFTGRAGAGIDFRLSDAVKFFVEIADNIYSDRFNSKKNLHTWKIFGKESKLDFDYNINAFAGLKFTFGQAKAIAAANAAAAAAAAKAEADRLAAERAAAERAAAERAAAEKARAEAEAARIAAERAAAEKAAAERAAARRIEEHVLFIIGRTNIRPSETPKIDAVIDILKTYPEAVVTVTGYADKDTGTAKINQRLSQQRAENVAKAIENAGISADRISVNYVGDTQKVSEVPAENRVAVLVTK